MDVPERPHVDALGIAFGEVSLQVVLHIRRVSRLLEVHSSFPCFGYSLHVDPTVSVCYDMQVPIDFVFLSGPEVFSIFREYFFPRGVGRYFVEPISPSESFLPYLAPAEPVEVLYPQVFVRAHD